MIMKSLDNCKAAKVIIPNDKEYFSPTFIPFCPPLRS
jgi:hypothetical protein